MIKIKIREEIELMRIGGRILAEVMFEVLQNIKPGVSELEMDNLAQQLITEKGGEVGFKRVKGYSHTICVSTNDVVVHGIPTDYKFREGDVVGIDCGVYYKGFHTDMAETRRVSTNNKQQTTNNKKDDIDKFLETGKKAIDEAIKVARVGNRVGYISKTIQDIVENEGYSVVRSLVGHGVGKDLHEEPEVPGFLTEPIGKTIELKEGMTLAIEAIYNMGQKEVVLSDDGWTIKTKDGSLSALFERTVAITAEGPVVLTD